MTINDIVKEYIRDLDKIITDDFPSEKYSNLVDLATSYFTRIYKFGEWVGMDKANNNWYHDVGLIRE